MSRKIEIVEVGPRDGLQNESAVLSIDDRLDYIRMLELAGARRIEVASFVNPSRVPQMAGAEAIRDVIAFPKTQRGQDLVTGAPSPVTERQLRELHIRLRNTTPQ